MGKSNNSKSVRLIWVVAICLCLLIGVIGCSKTRGQLSNEKEEKDLTQADIALHSEKEIIAHSTTIVEAKYLGIDDEEHELVFEVLNVMKGDTGGKSTIYVIPDSIDKKMGDGWPLSPYEEGEIYFLFLERNISVYYAHDKYVSLGNTVVSQKSDRWEELQRLIREYINSKEGGEIEYYGVPFIESGDIAAVVDYSPNIFVVEIESIYAESTVGPTTVYCCAVKQTIKNVPSKLMDGKILITLFNDTVIIGGQYVVLLGDATDTAPVYTLSSKSQSVYSLHDAEAISTLNELLLCAKEYPTA